MRVAIFDTHAEVEFLIGAGLEKRAAEAVVQTMYKSRDNDLGNLASKDQVAMLEKDVENIMHHSATKADLLETEKRLDEKINSIHNKMDEKIYQVRNEIHNSERRLMIMIGGATVAICGFVFSTLKYFIH